MIKDSKIDIFLSIGLLVLSGMLSPEITVVILALRLITMGKKMAINKYIFVMMLVFGVQGLINIFFGNDVFEQFMKQMIGISITSVYYYSAYKNGDKTIDVLKLYLNCAIIISFFLFIQHIAAIIGIRAIYDLRWLVHSQVATSRIAYRPSAIFSEPSECALFLNPACFLGLYRLLGRNKVVLKKLLPAGFSFVLAGGTLLTVSTVGMLGLLTSLFMIFFDYKLNIKKIAIFFMGVCLAITLFMNVPQFRERVADVITLLNGSDNNFISYNISSQTWVINFRIAIESFVHSFGFGSGLGSHPISYKKYYEMINIGNVLYFYNQDDANSLLFRVISELGLIGVISIIIFIRLTHSNKSNSINNPLVRIISKMSITYLILRFLRFGHYFNNGIGLFIILYWVVNKKGLPNDTSSGEEKRII